MISLVIGGTGTLGKKLVPILCKEGRVRVMSRDEHKQIFMKETLKKEHLEKIDWFIGDVRDRDRVKLASKGVDYIYNLAAVKSVDIAEYNPDEAIKTIVDGSRNVVFASLENKVKKAMYISTDKAVEPLNVYGSAKLCGEKLFIQSNSYSGENGPKFIAVRYGNVFGSNGSVLMKWFEGGEMLVTEPGMTRFFLTPEEAAWFVYIAMTEGNGGEIYIPKMKSTEMIEMAKVCKILWPEKKVKNICMRPGEKMHETLISKNEAHLVTDCKAFYIRWPSHEVFEVRRWGDVLPLGFEFTSENAEKFSFEELSERIKEVCV
jgi:UDP-N-acetylglucosamine 4,6-dehydratase/5-epimerase